MKRWLVIPYLWLWVTLGELRRRIKTRRSRAAGAASQTTSLLALAPSSAADPHCDPAQSRLPQRRLRVLWVSPYSIFPMIHGGAVRLGNLLRRLSARCDLYVLVMIGGSDDPEQRQQLAPFCREVFFQELRPAQPDAWTPQAAAPLVTPEIRTRLRALVLAHEIDLIQLEYSELGGLAALDLPVPVILVEHDVSFRSQARQRALAFEHRFAPPARRGKWHAWLLSTCDGLRRYHYEVKACARAAQIHVMSATDRDFLAPVLANQASRLRVIPNGVDTDFYRPIDSSEAPAQPLRQGLLFVGSFPHLPNCDALEYFLAEIWPRVRQRLPQAALTVAGARPPAAVLALAGRDGIAVAGEVPDLRPLYQSHRALVVPLRAGSGTRLKILEALASGLPVIATSVGAEGIAALPSRDLVIADTADAFAAAAVQLLLDDALMSTLASQGRQLAEQHYDWRPIADELFCCYQELVSGDFKPHEPSDAADAGLPMDLPQRAWRTAPPEISIIIPVARIDSTLERSLAMVRAQVDAPSSEVILVDCGLPAADLQTLAGQNDLHPVRLHPVRLRPEPRLVQEPTLMLNAGSAAARGRILVYLGAHAVPINAHWLRRLTAPFFDPNLPAAVQGGFHARFSPSEVRHFWDFPQPSRCWREQHGGVLFSPFNAAVRREVWTAYPFPGGSLLGGCRWQRMIQTSGQLILPILAAEVFVEPSLTPSQLWHVCWHEGRAWRELGAGYSLRGLLGDWNHPSAQAEFDQRCKSSKTQKVFSRIRPLALFLGNQLARFPRWLR